MAYLKLHQKYLFSIINLILILIVCISSIFIVIESYNLLINKDNYFYYVDAYEGYLENILLYLKFVVIMIFSFIWGSSFYKENDNYHLLINNYYKNKHKYFFTKLMLLIIVNISIYLLLYLILIFIPNFFSYWLTKSLDINLFFLNSLIISIYYGILSSIVVIFLQSIYASFIPVICLFLSNLFSETNNIAVKIYQLMFPNLLAYGNIHSTYGIYHLLVLLILSIFFLFKIYYYKK